jgi:hypothetical protein
MGTTTMPGGNWDTFDDSAAKSGKVGEFVRRIRLVHTRPGRIRSRLGRIREGGRLPFDLAQYNGIIAKVDRGW